MLRKVLGIIGILAVSLAALLPYLHHHEHVIEHVQVDSFQDSHQEIGCLVCQMLATIHHFTFSTPVSFNGHSFSIALAVEHSVFIKISNDYGFSSRAPPQTLL